MLTFRSSFSLFLLSSFIARIFTKNFETFFHLLMGAFSTIFAPDMTQPPGTVVILHRAAACQKEDFFPPTRGGFGGRQDKKRVFEENVKI